MSAGSFYFSHDYNALSDDKIKDLILEHGMRGYGIYWAIIESLYNNANALQTKYKRIAYDLREDEIVIRSVINDFELFTIYTEEKEYFRSESVARRLAERKEKSIKASLSAQSRWEKKQPMRTHSGTDAIASKTDAIKERKGKENKVNNIKERSTKFAAELQPFLPTFGKDLLNEFYKYWTEPNKSKTKMRFELERTFDNKRRLETWAKRDKQFNHNTSSKNEQPTTDNYTKEFKAKITGDRPDAPVRQTTSTSPGA